MVPLGEGNPPQVPERQGNTPTIADVAQEAQALLEPLARLREVALDTRRPPEAARRLESFGSPVVGWVRVTVDPADDSLFRVEPHPGEAAGG